MITRELLGEAAVPEGEPLRLYRRGQDFTIFAGRHELMNSRMSGSEEALAEQAIARLEGVEAPRILIGGYGMGFTLRAALRALPGEGEVTVAELVPEIIDWARGPMAALTGDCLDDPRTSVALGDVIEQIAGQQARWDAILLDVDNGPDGLTRASNGWLYTRAGLAAARAALRPGGVLAIWSAAPDPAFAKRLVASGFAVDEVNLRARRNGKGPRNVIWFAEKS